MYGVATMFEGERNLQRGWHLPGSRMSRPIALHQQPSKTEPKRLPNKHGANKVQAVRLLIQTSDKSEEPYVETPAEKSQRALKAQNKHGKDIVYRQLPGLKQFVRSYETQTIQLHFFMFQRLRKTRRGFTRLTDMSKTGVFNCALCLTACSNIKWAQS